jgi:hypothetical protein
MGKLYRRMVEGGEVRRMSVPVEIARAAYNLQNMCGRKYYCAGCPAYSIDEDNRGYCALGAGGKVPATWHITRANIKRLERGPIA